MFESKFGSFDGPLWEELCQQVFKRKYENDGYQEMPASPGDFGIEGFTIHTGWAFQCYCPNKHYQRSELYEKVRDKITSDLNKLEQYQKELVERLGQTKISRWIFVIPEVDKNKILVHVRKKEQEVREKKLSFISPDFTIYIYDGDYFITEINQIRSAIGEPLVFDEEPPIYIELKGEQEEYEKNIERKSIARLSPKLESLSYEEKLTQLSQRTIQSFLSSDGYFKRIKNDAPITHMKLLRLINEYEEYVAEISITWSGSAEELTNKVKDELASRVREELSPEITTTQANKIARYMVARWLAVCELDYD